MVPVILTAQPHPYDPSIGGGTGGSPAGGGAPIGGGLLILLSSWQLVMEPKSFIRLLNKRTFLMD